MIVVDKFGRTWDLSLSELCPECGQPDNCGECTHAALSPAEVAVLGGTLPAENDEASADVHLDLVCAQAGLEIMRHVVDVVRDREHVSDDAILAMTPDNITNLYEAYIVPGVDKIEATLTVDVTMPCVYDHDGFDTDGTEWHLCLTHDELALSADAPCAGWVNPDAGLAK